jgi:TonB family protein
MNLRLGSIYALVAIFAASGVGVKISAQNAGGGDSSQGEVVMTKLVAPVYPPLALQARIVGDVEVTVNVRPDGRIASVIQVSGYPLLKQAAMDSAQKSQFECRKCTAPETSYQLVYTFQLDDFTGDGMTPCTSATEAHQSGGSLVIESENHVTLVAQLECVLQVDPVEVSKKVRAMKCLYLWQCGRRDAN